MSNSPKTASDVEVLLNRSADNWENVANHLDASIEGFKRVASSNGHIPDSVDQEFRKIKKAQREFRAKVDQFSEAARRPNMGAFQIS